MKVKTKDKSLIGVKMKEINETLQELIIGILITASLLLVGTFLFIGVHKELIIGIIFGSSVAVGLAIHMYKTIHKTIELGPDDAIKYTRKVAITRMLVMIIAIVVAMTFTKLFNVIGVLLGMMGLKVSAYIQPMTKKYITNKIRKKGR